MNKTFLLPLPSLHRGRAHRPPCSLSSLLLLLLQLPSSNSFNSSNPTSISRVRLPLAPCLPALDVAVRCTANISVAPVTWSAGKILLNYLCRLLHRFFREQVPAVPLPTRLACLFERAIMIAACCSAGQALQHCRGLKLLQSDRHRVVVVLLRSAASLHDAGLQVFVVLLRSACAQELLALLA